MTIQTIIDAHIHFWHPDRVYIPWVADSKYKDATEYAKKVEENGVYRAIYVETNVDPHHGLVEADWISQYAEKISSPSFGGIAGIVAYAPVQQGQHVDGYLRTLTRLVGPRLKGVRHLIQDSSSDPNRICHPDFLLGVQTLGKYNLSFDLTINSNACPEQFPPLQILVAQCPQVQFVLDHMGKPPCESKPSEPVFEFWKSQIEALAKHKHVSCKVSGLVTELKNNRSKDALVKQLEPFVNVVYACFGPDRIMFGSDWPICESGATWQTWMDVITEITRHWPSKDKHKLFVTNAIRIYRLHDLQSPI
ncbi:hypothetical protein G6F56_005831 [Rhizopus delemar]|uniref:Amidohydrolase-related domain-containing protein n=1 Tax=Rhizopus stolonifer TaxID=4846 RepID=A0A367KQR3_RHIST|nr:hypothetical protein G6F56_005831 [Rhizopus delemar]RCI04529.1 hypothetical protein CU098_003598 [Rhizopus stolonifer]